MKQLIEKIPGYNRLVLPYHWWQAFRAASKNNYPASGLKVIGVTGTNGKTTTSFMIYRMLLEAGKKVGLMTTVAYGVGNDIKPQIEHMTTVSAGLLNQRIRDIADAGAEYLVLELTSHALAQFRAFGVPIDVAVMTNVTHEHLDYHKTFTKYRDAKRKLFKLTNKTRGGKHVGIINADDKNAELFAGDIREPLTYGIKQGDLLARQVKLSPNGVEYFVKYNGRRLHIKTQIPGQFNVYNSLAAVAVGVVYDLTDEQIEKGISALEAVNGRMNRVDEGQAFTVVVDFGHTPDAFEKVFSTMKPKNGRLIIVFGSPGRRDSSTYEPKGEIAGRYGDLLVLTEDDARDVPVREISAAHARGAKKAGKTLDKDMFIIDDRTKAIEFAFKKAKAGDVVLLMTKGHESTIIRADGEHPWSDEAVARKILKKVLAKPKHS
jgi:UDP-N-acetylmuramoyl-L-alanyl-D-glutamate--2,6-diaminopimelate ligase